MSPLASIHPQAFGDDGHAGRWGSTADGLSPTRAFVSGDHW